MNFVCSTVSTLHTAITTLGWFQVSFLSWWLIIDNAVNCATMFAMFASNRRLLLHCCCCYRKCNDCRDDQHHRGPNGIPPSPCPSPTEEPSLKTLSDFPQPQGVLNGNNSDSGNLSDDEAGNKRTYVPYRWEGDMVHMVDMNDVTSFSKFFENSHFEWDFEYHFGASFAFQR